MNRETMFSSKTGVHHTPEHIAEAARAVMGRIDLDPASSYEANQIIKADRYYVDVFDTNQPNGYSSLTTPGCMGANGFGHSWQASSIWLNPPYTVDKRNPYGEIITSPRTQQPIRERVIDRWVNRWLAALHTNKVRDARHDLQIEAAQGMLLVPARTDTGWFAPLWGLPMCFISGRLRFSDAKAGAPFPVVIVYAGVEANEDEFYRVFSRYGTCGRFRQN